MDSKFLRKYISECPLNDFTDEGNIEERQLQLDKYLEGFTAFLYSNEDNLVQTFWEQYFVSSQVILIKQSQLLRRCMIFFDVAVGIYNQVSTKYIKNRKSSESAKMLSVQLQNTFNLFKSIITLTMNGCFYSVISEYRTMYESFVVERYLLKHPELLPVYKIHSELIGLCINKMSIYFPKEQEDRYNEILQEYGKDFLKDFGWTKSIIVNPNNRKLITLANECNIEPFFKPLYHVACEYVHPSSLASTTKTNLDSIKTFLQVAMYILLYEIEDYIAESRVVTKDAVIMKNMLFFIFDDINKTFFNNLDVK